MKNVLVGTSSWADHTLVESGGFYPPEVKTPAERLRYYADEFPIAEIDSSYHYFPTRRNSDLWLENTPPGFTFDIRAFAMFTGHPTRPNALPKTIRDEHEDLAHHEGNLYLHHLPEDVVDRLWGIFTGFAGRMAKEKKLGVVLFQFPPWFHPNEENREYLGMCRARLPGFRLAVEFRTGDWLAEDKRAETLALLRKHELSLVCVDEPQGLKSSVPPMAEVTSPVAMVRFHGRNADAWEDHRSTPEDRFKYLYTEKELEPWAEDVRRMAAEADKVHVIFKNKWQEYPITNARQFTKLLG